MYNQGHVVEASDYNLKGLRNLLDDWNSGRGPERERDEKAAKARQDATQAHIYSSYIKQAEQEDRNLLGRWTETSNIVLVFSGLQSTVVVAFIMFAEASSSDDSSQTNALLQSIFHLLNNSTVLAGENQPLSDPLINVRISACWYASLACSLLSAFGALLSKQWAIHYAGRPLWADSAILYCRLREMRHDGLGRWKLGWLMDSLITLLQISVLAFAIGLIFHLRDTSLVHFAILLSFTALGAAFFMVTLITGAFISACPFKSSVTESVYRTSLFLAFALPAQLLSVLLGTLRIFSVLCNVREVSRWTCRGIAWCESKIGRGDKAYANGDIERRAVEHNRAGTTGILCWWLLQEDPHAEDNVDTKAVVEEIASLPPMEVLSRFTQKQSFTFWSVKVVNNLRSITGSLSPRHNYHLQMGDILCHFMYHSWWANLFALRSSKTEYDNPPREFCAVFRAAWCKARQTDVLPIRQMPWTTVSLYFQIQVRSWAPLWENGGGLDRDELYKELLALLEDPRLEDNSLEMSFAAALAALVLVDEDRYNGYDHRINMLLLWSPAERILQGLHILSNYPASSRPPELLVSVVRASANRISNYLDNYDSSLITCHCWKNGDLAGTLLKLLRLGYSWRSQDVPESRDLGERMTNEVQRMMHKVLSHFINMRMPRGWFILSSAEGLATVLQAYGHPSTVLPLNTNALHTMDFVLGLRHHRPPIKPGFYIPWIREGGPSISPNIRLPNILSDHPHILTQLICDIERSESFSHERRIILSVLIKGRDIFFLAGNSNLQEALDSAGALMIQSRNTLGPVEDAYFLNFNHWGEIVTVLRRQERDYLNQAENSGAIGQGGVSLDA